MKSNASIESVSSHRILIIDELRAIAVFLMVTYHLMYSLEFIFAVELPFSILTTPFWIWVQRLSACLFIWISGFSSRLSRHLLRNATRLAFISSIITAVTTLFLPSERILFGVLHFLSIMMFITYIYAKLLKYNHSEVIQAKWSYLKLTISLSLLLLFIACYRIGSWGWITNKNYFTSIIGFPSHNFYSADYFPLLPWGILFYSGYTMTCAIPLKVISRISLCHKNKVIASIGGHSLWVYILHQPVIIGLFYFFRKLIQLK